MTSIAPRLVPCFAGENHALMVQFAPTGKLEPQVFVWLKFGAAVMLLILSAVVPVLVSVNV